jgi:hypothetical protein
MLMGPAPFQHPCPVNRQLDAPPLGAQPWAGGHSVCVAGLHGRRRQHPAARASGAALPGGMLVFPHALCHALALCSITYHDTLSESSAMALATAVCEARQTLVGMRHPCRLSRLMAKCAPKPKLHAPQVLSSRHRVQQRRQAELQRHLAQQDAAARAAQARSLLNLVHHAARICCCHEKGERVAVIFSAGPGRSPGI